MTFFIGPVTSIVGFTSRHRILSASNMGTFLGSIYPGIIRNSMSRYTGVYLRIQVSIQTRTPKSSGLPTVGNPKL